MSVVLNELRGRLEEFLTEVAGTPAQIAAARQLTGGASRITWALDVDLAGIGRQPLVLRLDMGGVIVKEALSREQEFRVLQAATVAGIRAPRPRWLCTNCGVLGAPFFLMDRLEGESVGRRIVKEPALAEARRLLPRQMGEQLGRIHRLNADLAGLTFLPRPAADSSPALTALDNTLSQLDACDEPHPVLELAARWLRQHVPPCPELVLIHGDYRIGNMLVGPDGLRGILDWEFAHLGDPAEDLAWPCVRSWRFGRDDLRFGGVGGVDEFFAAYETTSGRRVDPDAITYWEILGNLRWAVGCVVQARRHLSGQAPSLELASLGRRAAEMELELLNLLER